MDLHWAGTTKPCRSTIEDFVARCRMPRQVGGTLAQIKRGNGQAGTPRGFTVEDSAGMAATGSYELTRPRKVSRRHPGQPEELPVC